MFCDFGIIKKSGIIDLPHVCHGFSTKRGGVSSHPYTREMNLAPGREDDPSTVRKNYDIFAGAITGGEADSSSCVSAPQIHSDKVRKVGRAERGEGVLRDGEPCDGFVTDESGVLLVVRVADCTPLLMAGEADGHPVVAAVHAGWRGTAADIAGVAVRMMVSLGVSPEKIKAAIGAHIGACCYEVGEDMRDEVARLRGREFSERHIKERDGRLFADMTGMNRELLTAAGIDGRNIDVSPDCTSCMSGLYHSHRATGGKRGAMGAGIVILP